MTCSLTRTDGVWLGILLLAAGVCGVLDVTGVIDAKLTIGQWWPLAIIGWVATGVVAAWRISLVAIGIMGAGLGLLADAQSWALRGLVWSLVFGFTGVAIIASVVRRRTATRD
jgi:hypothetical protein